VRAQSYSVEDNVLTLELHRFAFGETSTLGKLYVDGVPSRRFECFVLEDERRAVKVAHETCIPPGVYEILLREGSPSFGHYDTKFDNHKGVPHLQAVPDFEWIYIHPGNRESQTSGCLLPGLHPVILPDGEFEVHKSTQAYLELYRKIKLAIDAGDRVAIHITEDVRPKA
jgi:hypothetical protein